jgi:hypothetical protein
MISIEMLITSAGGSKRASLKRLVIFYGLGKMTASFNLLMYLASSYYYDRYALQPEEKHVLVDVHNEIHHQNVVLLVCKLVVERYRYSRTWCVVASYNLASSRPTLVLLSSGWTSLLRNTRSSRLACSTRDQAILLSGRVGRYVLLYEPPTLFKCMKDPKKIQNHADGGSRCLF